MIELVKYRSVQQAKSVWLFFFVVSCFIICSQSIYQSCSFNTDCPTQAFCGYRKYCVCNNNYIMNCDITSVTLVSNPYRATITQTYSYFTIQPQKLYQYLKFSIVISTNQTTVLPIIFTIWGQSGYLSSLTDSNKLYSVQLNIGPNATQTIDTTYFQFGLQPNGQAQQLYVGVKINSAVPQSYFIDLSVNQQSAYNQDIFRLIVTVLMAAMSVACLVLLAFCIYKRKRLQRLRQRAEQQKQIKSTDHFDQYMPIVKADRVKVPLQICSVCLIEITRQNPVRLTICRHLFHAQCIDSWCKKNISCPICRQELDLQNCQKILGQGLDLTQRDSMYKVVQEKNKKSVEIQMMQRNDNTMLIEEGTQHQNPNQNSMRRRMLD